MHAFFRETRAALILALVLMMATGCGPQVKSDKVADDSSKSVKSIQSAEEFKRILDESGNQLLGFDLYADWCGPCRMLAPVLEEIASENKDKIAFYKIDTMNHPDLARAFQVSSIPYVVFIKNKKTVHALTGLRRKNTYLKIINQFSEKGEEQAVTKANGKLIDGVRVIRFSPGVVTRNLYVYRGETVKLLFDKLDYQYSVHIPAFNVSKEAEKGKALELVFKASKTGVFPLFCNGDCPAGDGARHANIIVMQYKTSRAAVFHELSAKEGKQLIASKKPLILDVRTPREYYAGHLANAKLIPVQQLADRISEIADYKNNDILVYCRSGNRSTVASEILVRNGFKKIHNMKNGITGWEKDGFETIK